MLSQSKTTHFLTLLYLISLHRRTQLKIGVIYAAKGQRVEDVFANVSGSQDYQEFLSTLGWPVRTQEYTRA